MSGAVSEAATITAVAAPPPASSVQTELPGTDLHGLSGAEPLIRGQRNHITLCRLIQIKTNKNKQALPAALCLPGIRLQSPSLPAPSSVL